MPAARLPKPVLLFRWGLLGLLAAPVSLLLAHRLGYPVHFWPCPMKTLTGVPCPTWGMTRSMLAIATGNWSQAIHYNLLGPVLLCAWLAALIQVLRVVLTRQPTLWPRWVGHRAVLVTVLFTVFSIHGLRLYWLWSAGVLQTDFANSPLGHLLLGA